MKLYSILILFFLLPFVSEAQHKSDITSSFLSIGFNIGASTYYGDMDSGNTWKYKIDDMLYASPAASLSVAYNHHPRFVTELSFLAGKLKGDDARSSDAGRRARNLNFFSPYYEVSLMEEIHVLGVNTWEDNSGFSIYLKGGVSGYFFNPKTKDKNGSVVELQPLGTEGQGAPGYDPKYSLYRWCIPFGGGLRYKIDNYNSISFEILSRYTGFDHIDDLAGSYAPKDVLLANGGEKAVELSDRRAQPEWSGKRGQLDDPDYIFTYMLTYRRSFLKGRSIENPK